MVEAFINRIATAVPSHDVHRFFHRYAASLLSGDPRRRALFLRMAERSGIEHRFSCFAPGDDPDGASLDREGTFRRGAFPARARAWRCTARPRPFWVPRPSTGCWAPTRRAASPT